MDSSQQRPDPARVDLQELADLVRRRAAFYDALAASDDPMWREIGTQLRDGQMRPRDVFSVEQYREHVLTAFERNRDTFPATLAALREQADAQPPATDGDDRRR